MIIGAKVEVKVLKVEGSRKGGRQMSVSGDGEGKEQ